jgi:hypothetical protein
LRRQISEAEDLLAMADSSDERAWHSRRLRYLMTQLGVTSCRPVNLSTEQAYYDRLCDKLEGGTKVSPARRRKDSPDS